MALSAFVSVLNTSMVNIAIPLIGHDLDVSADQTGWIITGYSLVFAIGELYGRLFDIYSLRRTFSLALVIFAACSLICTLAPSFSTLVMGRAVQAAGAAAIPALAFGSVANIFPPGSRGMTFGILSSSVGLGIYQLFFFLGAGAGTAVLGAFLTARKVAQSGAINPLYALTPDAAPFSDSFLLAGLAARPRLRCLPRSGMSALTGQRRG